MKKKKSLFTIVEDIIIGIFVFMIFNTLLFVAVLKIDTLTYKKENKNYCDIHGLDISNGYSIESWEKDGHVVNGIVVYTSRQYKICDCKTGKIILNNIVEYYIDSSNGFAYFIGSTDDKQKLYLVFDYKNGTYEIYDDSNKSSIFQDQTLFLDIEELMNRKERQKYYDRRISNA